MRESAIIETHLDQTLTSAGGQPLPPAPFYVIGTATPEGPTDWNELQLKRLTWIDHLAEMGVASEPGYAIGPIQSWVEPVIFAHGTDDVTARSIAADCLLEFHVAVRADGIEVIDWWGKVRARGPLHVPDVTGVCVMPNENPGKVCVMRGGPYTSSAISAAADWAEQRTRLIAALGCETCEQGRLYGFGREGRIFTGGGPISLVGHPVVTRYTADLGVSNA